MDEGYTMKRPIIFILLLIIIGVLIGVSISYGTYYGINKTGSENFCVSCHEMDSVVMSYKDDVHGGKGELGASARCVDCHLPHDSLVNYIYTKATTGLAEVGVHFLGNLDEIDWQEKRYHRQFYVYDSGCLQCHGNVLDNTLSSPSKQAQKMHKHYKKLKGTQKEIKCASCHFDAGHKGLRNFLNYYKPEYSIYKDKMEEKKEEVQQKYKRYGVEVDEE